MQIAQIEADKYAMFNSIENVRDRNAQINAIKYIKSLASMSNTNIMHWNIIDLFSKDGKILTERQAINKVFFLYKEKAPANPTTVPEAMFTKLMALTASRQRYSCANLEDQARRKLNDAVGNYNYYLKALKDAAGMRRRLQAMQGYVPNYALEIEQLCLGGFYILKDVTSSSVQMETVNDVILVHVNEQHGVKRSVNLGRFMVDYSLLHSHVEVYPCGNNVRASGYYHPHVSASNNVCFGEIQNEAHDFIASGNLTATMEIVQKVLTTYNDGSPYCVLEQFELAKKRLEEQEAAGEQLAMPDEDDDSPEDDPFQVSEEEDIRRATSDSTEEVPIVTI